jgi:hypothetical protein
MAELFLVIVLFATREITSWNSLLLSLKITLESISSRNSKMDWLKKSVPCFIEQADANRWLVYHVVLYYSVARIWTKMLRTVPGEWFIMQFWKV